MNRLAFLLSLLLVIAPGVFSQSIPKELLTVPTRLEMANATQQVKAGTPVTFKVVLKNAKGQPVPALHDTKLEIETPSGRITKTLPAGQSAITFSLPTEKSGIVQITVRAGKLHPASGRLLVAPSVSSATPIARMAQPRAGMAAREALPLKVQPRMNVGALARRNAGNAARARAQPAPRLAVRAPAPPAAAAPAAPPATEHASKIQLFVEPLPIYGNAIDHVWTADIAVAALDNHDSLAAVANDVTVHFHANRGHLASHDIVLRAGQYGNFNDPVLLTADHPGDDTVQAVSNLGQAVPVSVQYLQPRPAGLHFSHNEPVLTGTGSSTTRFQVCLVDESGAVTSSTKDVEVSLSGPGQYESPVKIMANLQCSRMLDWASSTPGPAILRADAVGLTGEMDITFPSFPWYLVWLAALGGLLGALLFSSGKLFTSRWWSHAWRSLVLGAAFGAVFYLFARFGAIALPKGSPVDISKIPVVSGAGSFILGFLGGLYGRRLWKTSAEKPGSSAPPSPANRPA